MPILLFDIDGTLVRTGGAGKAAMEGALRTAFGVKELNDTVPYSGRTDRAISRDLLTVHGIDPTPENQKRLTETYLEMLPSELNSKGGEVCPGILEILSEAKRHESVLLGLLTGNVRRGAAKKLGHFDLWNHFTVGGFGDDHFDRDDVARSAVAAVQAHVGQDVNFTDLWIIGDTPLDVQCARAVGAKVIAVATGWNPLSELEACQPDVVLEDLSNTRDLMRMWGFR